jgi:hypothetical protein
MIRDIVESLGALPAWVVAWMFLALAPVNLASLFFLNEPNGILISILALAGIVPNVIILLFNRGIHGVADLMTVPHMIAWPPLFYVAYTTFLEIDNGAYLTYLCILLAVNLVSLVFDFRDAFRWLRGRWYSHAKA